MSEAISRNWKVLNLHTSFPRSRVTAIKLAGKAALWERRHPAGTDTSCFFRRPYNAAAVRQCEKTLRHMPPGRRRSQRATP